MYNNLNEAFVEELSRLKTLGTVVNSRGSKQIEVTFSSLTIKDPRQLDIEVPARKFNKKYAIAEWLWYLSGIQKVNNISKLASIWSDIQDKYGEAESNYGTYIFSVDPSSVLSQWDWVVEELKSDRDSRRATIVINQPYHKERNSKDYPCTHYIHFFIRNGNLDMGVYMRSNDAIFGFCNDVFTFSLFQQLMLNQLNCAGMKLRLGSYHHHAGSFHVYERHFNMMDNILNNYYVQAARHHYPEMDRIILKPGVTYEKILSIGADLPSKDMTKKEIYEHVDKFKGELFDVKHP
jgi:thymidylate synthase